MMPRLFQVKKDVQDPNMDTYHYSSSRHPDAPVKQQEENDSIIKHCYRKLFDFSQ